MIYEYFCLFITLFVRFDASSKVYFGLKVAGAV